MLQNATYDAPVHYEIDSMGGSSAFFSIPVCGVGGKEGGRASKIGGKAQCIGFFLPS